MVFDAKTVSMLVKETWRTLYMVGLSSLISYLIGIPLGVALVVTDKDGIRPVPLFNKVAGVIVNLLRSVPYIILSDGNAADPRDRGKDDRSKCGSCTAGNRGVPVHQPYGRGIIKGN